MESLAARYGFPSGKVLHDHPDNAELKKKRPDPGMLQPGDEVTIPDRKGKQATVKAGRTHAFEVKRPRRTLRLELRGKDSKPISGASWSVQDREGQQLAAGTTDGGGRLEARLPATEAYVILEVAGMLYEVRLGGLDPLEEEGKAVLSGVRSRLRNLGYDPGQDGDGDLANLTAVLEAFQRSEGIEITGEPDRTTLDKLREVHGC
jgi:N-acetylmuramoyl-L-alanine amidase